MLIKMQANFGIQLSRVLGRAATFVITLFAFFSAPVSFAQTTPLFILNFNFNLNLNENPLRALCASAVKQIRCGLRVARHA